MPPNLTHLKPEERSPVRASTRSSDSFDWAAGLAMVGVVVVAVNFFWFAWGLLQTGWYWLVTTVMWAGYVFLTLLGGATGYSALEPAGRIVKHWWQSLRATRYAVLPTLEAVATGTPRSSVEAILLEIFLTQYRESYGCEPVDLDAGEFLRVRPDVLRKARSHPGLQARYRELIGALYAELQSGNEKVSQWVETANQSERRRRFGWTVLALICFISGGRLFRYWDSWVVPNIDELKTSPQKFEGLCFRHMFMGLLFWRSSLRSAFP